MSNFSADEQSCRVDIWKASGKWYDTINLIWDEGWADGGRIHSTFRNLMEDQYPGKWLGMHATCLEPFHKYSHPISIKL